MAKRIAPASRKAEPNRFAHPFFVPAAAKPKGAGRMLDHIEANLQPVPRPRTAASTMTLPDIIGTAGAHEIVATGKLTFHATGDTGKGADTPQGDVAEAMAAEFAVTKPAHAPAFFLHLGDVIYGVGKDARYRGEFYEPYAHYPGKIIAIPGNHDGEVFTKSDPTTLRSFLANFCAPSQKVPAVAGTIYRETMNQPGVYWLLDTPLVQIIALYSNAAENPGFISGGAAGTAQKAWLVKTLGAIASARKKGLRRALVMATHHPPFTAGGHSPSTNMLADIDDACRKAGVMPDLFLSGHSHSFQQYTRRVTFNGKALEIPYLVVGCGGINDQAVPKAYGQVSGDHTYVNSRQGYGFLTVTVTARKIVGAFTAVNGQDRELFCKFKVDLATSKVS